MRKASEENKSLLTHCNTEEIFVACPVYFNVTGAHEMLVPTQSEISVLATLESNQRLSISATLPAQTKSNATSDSLVVHW